MVASTATGVMLRLRVYRLTGALAVGLLLLFVALQLLVLHLSSAERPQVAAARPPELHLLQGSVDQSLVSIAGGSGAGGGASEEDEVHRPLEMDGRTILALALSLVVSALANSAGVGGGAFFVPLFNVVTQFSVKMATALSQAVIVGGAVGSTAYALSRRHPLDRKRPLADFELALLLLPTLLLGVSAGVLLNVVFPTWVITGCLLALLCYLTARTAATSARLHAVEARLHQMQQVPASPSASGSPRGRGRRTAAGPQPPLRQQQHEAAAAVGGDRREDEGEEQQGAAEDQPLLSRGSSDRSAALPWATHSPSASQPASPARSLLAGLLIAGRKQRRRSQEPRPESSPGSYCSYVGSYVGSYEERCCLEEEGPGSAGHGRSAGLLQRELSMQRVSAAATQQAHRLASVHSAQKEEHCQQQQQQPGGASFEPAGAREEGSEGGQQGPKAAAPPLPYPARSWSGTPAVPAALAAPSTAPPWRQAQQQGPDSCSPPDAVASISLSTSPAGFPSKLLRPSPFQPPAPSPARSAAGSYPASVARGEEGEALADGDAFQAGLHAEVSELQLDERRFPWRTLGALLALWAAFLGFQLAKSRLNRCSWGYAGIYLVQTLVALGVSVAAGRQMLLRQQQAAEAAAAGAAGTDLEQPILASTSAEHSPSTPSSPTAYHRSQSQRRLLPQHWPAPVQQQRSGGCSGAPGVRAVAAAAAASAAAGGAGAGAWTPRRLVWVLSVVLMGGALSGLLGIGGGMIVGPLMLELGIHPQVSSATSGLMVLFSSSLAAVSFAASGRLNPQYAAAFGGVCLASAFLGVLVVGRLVKRSGKASIIVMILAGIMGLGAALTAVYAGSKAVSDLIHGRNIGFSPFCTR